MSAHDTALAELRSWSPPDDDQGRLRDSYLAHLESHDDGLLRSCLPGHLTAGALVLSADLDAVLLNLHRKAGRWFHFGGHCEPGDGSLLGTASREAVEESGLTDLLVDPVPVQLNRHTVVFCSTSATVDHLDVRYAAVASPSAGARASEESLEVRWWPLTALPDLEPEMHELIARALSRAQDPGSPLSSRAPAE